MRRWACWLAVSLFVGCGAERSEQPIGDSISARAVSGSHTPAVRAQRWCCTFMDEPLYACEDLHGEDRKTWEVIRLAGGEAAGASPFVNLTVYADGTWTDSAGTAGIWRVDRDRSEIAFLPDGSGSTVRCHVVQMSPEEVVLEIDRCGPNAVVTLFPSM
jgi:hypothetical protein